jgi:hypothetical protein
MDARGKTKEEEKRWKGLGRMATLGKYLGTYVLLDWGWETWKYNHVQCDRFRPVQVSQVRSDQARSDLI